MQQDAEREHYTKLWCNFIVEVRTIMEYYVCDSHIHFYGSVITFHPQTRNFRTEALNMTFHKQTLSRYRTEIISKVLKRQQRSHKGNQLDRILLCIKQCCYLQETYHFFFQKICTMQYKHKRIPFAIDCWATVLYW